MAIFLPDIQALFVHIPKTGGTWVKKVLRASGLKVEDAKGPGSHGLPSMYRDGGRRFCFVRTPLEWYWSAWRGLHSSWPARREVAPLHQERTWSPIRMLTYLAGAADFDTFCETILREQPSFVSRMYEWYIGPPGAPQVNAVGRLENLATDLAEIIKSFGFTGQLADFPPENVGPNVSGLYMDTAASLLESETVALNRFYTTPGPFFLTE